MRVRLAAATCAVIVLVFVLGAPVIPVMIGATVAYGWLVWRAVATR
jgi:hypothetical protein